MRYVPVQGEALAVGWALRRSRHFTLGIDKLIVLMDHKPLLKILGDRDLADIKNPRILNLKQESLRRRFSLEHVTGKDNHVVDAIRHGICRKLYTDICF